jgi:hypothetical protein
VQILVPAPENRRLCFGLSFKRISALLDRTPTASQGEHWHPHIAIFPLACALPILARLCGLFIRAFNQF